MGYAKGAVCELCGKFEASPRDDLSPRDAAFYDRLPPGWALIMHWRPGDQPQAVTLCSPRCHRSWLDDIDERADEGRAQHVMDEVAGTLHLIGKPRRLMGPGDTLDITIDIRGADA